MRMELVFFLFDLNPASIRRMMVLMLKHSGLHDRDHVSNIMSCASPMLTITFPKRTTLVGHFTFQVAESDCWLKDGSAERQASSDQ